MHISILFVKGYYSFHRHEIDLDSMVNVPFKERYWTLKLEGYKREENVMCEKKVRLHLQDKAPRVRMADKRAKEHELKQHSRTNAIQYSL